MPPSTGSAPVVLEIGGVLIRIASVDPLLRLDVPPPVARFQRHPVDTVDIDITAAWADLSTAAPTGPLLFDSNSLWRLYQNDDHWEWWFTSPAFGPTPYKHARFTRDLRAGQVRLHRPSFTDAAHYPLEYPLDELLVTNWLSRGRGVELHGCAVIDADGRGYVFVGYSGAGKTTTARLWQQQPGVTVLTDDRVIVRLVDGRPHMYGTPWHGDEPLAAQASAHITAVFVLEHGEANAVLPLDRSDAVAALVARCFPPFYDREGMACTLELLDMLAARVPINRLRFVPDTAVIDDVRAHTSPGVPAPRTGETPWP